jgi:polysaccharide biosynthesis/export protein
MALSISPAEKAVENSSNGALIADGSQARCATLLFKIQDSQGSSMKSGTGLTCRGWTVSLVLAFLSVAGLSAQQSADGPKNKPAEGQNAAPTNLPPPQPISQDAISASSGNASAEKTGDTSKDSPEKSSIVTLGAGDLIEVSVYNVPELASKVRVSNSGDIYLPLIDYVHVEGLTQEEAQSLIEKRLADGGFVRSPHVTIFIDEFTSQGVTILGEVGRPGIYPDIGDHKLYQVISQAGGFSQNASRKITILRRNQNDPIHIVLPRNLGDDQSGNVEILPGDTITVPRAPIIYVVGDVGRPSGILADNGTMTVLQALALAGGANKTAKLGDSRILRKGPNGGVMETKVGIKKMLEAKAPDVSLQADDILFIPISGGKVLAGRTFEATMSVATALALYTIHP